MTDFDDFPASDDLAATLAAPARQAPPADAAFVRIRAFDAATPMVACPRCRGTGQTPWGPCFKCKGTRQVKGFKTAAPVRAANREKAAARKVRNADANWTAFVERFPAEAAWMLANPSFGFACDMVAKVRQYGDLFPNAMVAVQRCVARDAAKAEARKVQAAAPVTHFPQLQAAFDALLAKGVRRAQMTAGDLNFSLADVSKSNPGAVYVKDAGVYVGKIVKGVFYARREAGPTTVARMVVVEADPKAAVMLHARMTAERLAAAAANGETLTLPCGCCGLTLSDPVSVQRGIGPICAGKWGF